MPERKTMSDSGQSKTSTIKITGPPKPEVHGNRYRMLAIAVSRENGIALSEAMSLTLVEAYLSLGATFHGY
jgi:hypothetical protein